MRLGIESDAEIVQPADHGILAGGELVHLRIVEHEVALAHGALHFDDGVAHHAPQPGLRLRTVHDLLDRRIHHAAVKHRGIMTACAPLGRPRALDVLHVLDTLAIPLIVERRKMMCRALPLLVDILMAALAGIRFHEVF